MTKTIVYKGVAITGAEASTGCWRVRLSTIENIITVRAKSHEEMISKVMNYIDTAR